MKRLESICFLRWILLGAAAAALLFVAALSQGSAASTSVVTVSLNPTAAGDLGTNHNTSWAVAETVADCTTCTAPGYLTTESSVGNQSGTALYSIIRSGLVFDTSFIGRNATITAATLTLRAQAQVLDYTGGAAIRLVSADPVSYAGFTLNDFNMFGSVPLAGDMPISSIAQNGFVTFNLNPAGIAAISRTGLTAFGLRTTVDTGDEIPVPGTDPTFANYGGCLIFWHADSSSGPLDSPTLTISYTNGTAPAPSPTPTPTPSPKPKTRPTPAPSQSPSPSGSPSNGSNG